MGQFARAGLRLGSNIVLTSMLTSADFGLSTLVHTVLTGLELLSDLGIEASIIQNKRGEEANFLDTCFTIQALRGLFLFAVACALAAPAAVFFEAEPLAQLIPVAALSAVIRGFWPTKLHLLRRNLEVSKSIAIDLTSQIAAFLVTAAYAYVYRSVWALIIGAVTSNVVPLLIAHALPGQRNRFRLEPTAVREVISFGKWIILSSLITYGADSFNVLASGRLVDKSTLGVFGIATALGSLPLVIGGHATNAVLLPALSEFARKDRETFSGAFDRAQDIILPLLMLACLGLALLGPSFFFFLYRSEYHDAGWMVQLFMPGVWFYYLQDVTTRGLLALGVSRPLVAINLVKLLGTASFALGGFHLFGFPGLVAGGSIGSLCGYITVSIAGAREGFATYQKHAAYSFIALAVGGAGAYLPAILADLLPGIPRAAIAVATSVPLLFPFFYLTFKRIAPFIQNRNAGA